jgi:hypothetical protein
MPEARSCSRCLTRSRWRACRSVHGRIKFIATKSAIALQFLPCSYIRVAVLRRYPYNAGAMHVLPINMHPIPSSSILQIQYHTPSLSQSLPELGRPLHILDSFKLLPHLHHRVSNQSRIQSHCSSQRMLRSCTRIEAHNEVVSVVVRRLQLFRGLG